MLATSLITYLNHLQSMNLLEHFVGGKLISGSSDRKSKIFNPATGQQESEVRLASKSDLGSSS